MTSGKPKLAFDLIRPQVRKVESAIRAQVEAFDRDIIPYVDYVCQTSGKRLRPALAILTGGAIEGTPNENHLKVGVILELIHMASLVHDDIIDRAETRRDKPTPNHKWGDGLAVLLGDAMFAHAMTMATDFNRIDICRKVGNASRAVCEGEILQSQSRFDLKLTKARYFEVIGMKTGALFAAACSLSAAVSDVDPALELALHDAGMKLGTAYQVYDDCLDLVGDEREAGKTLRTDLERGKLTLPLLHILEHASSSQKRELQRKIKTEQRLDLDFLDTIMPFHQAVNEAVLVAKTMLKDCQASFLNLPDSKYREALLELPDSLCSMLSACER